MYPMRPPRYLRIAIAVLLVLTAVLVYICYNYNSVVATVILIIVLNLDLLSWYLAARTVGVALLDNRLVVQRGHLRPLEIYYCDISGVEVGTGAVSTEVFAQDAVVIRYRNGNIPAKLVLAPRNPKVFLFELQKHVEFGA